MNQFDIQQRVCLTAQIRQDGVLTDPATVAFRIESPDGTVLEYEYGTDVELVQLEAGVYQVEQIVDVAGVWSWKVESTGTPHMARQSEFYVRTELIGQ